MRRALQSILLLCVVSAVTQAGESKDFSEKIQALAHHSNTNEATNIRLYKIVYWIEQIKRENGDVNQVLNAALNKSCTNSAAVIEFMRDSLLRNLQIAKHHECLDEENLKRMQKGEPPIIRRKPREGVFLVAEPIVPITNCVALASMLSNFEFAPAESRETSNLKRMRRGRQQIFADKFRELGLMSAECYQKFMESKDGRN